MSEALQRERASFADPRLADARERWIGDLDRRPRHPLDSPPDRGESDGAWRWNPGELMLRDYYANSLLTFEEVKRRGWPERKRDEKAVAAAREAAAV